MDAIQPTIRVEGETLLKVSTTFTVDALTSVRNHDFSPLSGTTAQRREAVASAASAGTTMHIVAPTNLLTNVNVRWYSNSSDDVEREELKNTLIQLQVQQSHEGDEGENQNEEEAQTGGAPMSLSPSSDSDDSDSDQEVSDQDSGKRGGRTSRNTQGGEGRSRNTHTKERNKIKDTIDDVALDEALNKCLHLPRGIKWAFIRELVNDLGIMTTHELVDFALPDIEENLQKVEGINWNNENTLLSVMEGIHQIFYPDEPRMGKQLMKSLDVINPSLRRMIEKISKTKRLYIFDLDGLRDAYQQKQLPPNMFVRNEWSAGIHTRTAKLGWQKSFLDLIGLSITTTPSPAFENTLRSVISEPKRDRLVQNGVIDVEKFNQAFNSGHSDYNASLEKNDPTNLTEEEVAKVNYALREKVSAARRRSGDDSASASQQSKIVSSWNYPCSRKKMTVKLNEMQMYGHQLTNGIPSLVWIQVANLDLMQLTRVLHLVQPHAKQTITLSGSTIHNLSELPCVRRLNCLPEYNMLTKEGQFEEYVNQLYVVDDGATNGETAKILELRSACLQTKTSDKLNSMVDAKYLLDSGFHDVFPGIGTFMADLAKRISKFTMDLRVPIESRQAAEIFDTAVRTVQENMMQERMQQGVVPQRKYVPPAVERFKLATILGTEFQLMLDARLVVINRTVSRELISEMVSEAAENSMVGIKRKSNHIQETRNKKQETGTSTSVPGGIVPGTNDKKKLDAMIMSAHSKNIHFVKLKAGGCKWCAYNKVIGSTCKGKHKNALYPKLTLVQLAAFNTPQDFIDASE